MWTEFFSMTDERLKILASFDSKKASRNVKACDNLQCSKFDMKTAFSRCSGCQSFYYCSQSCHTTDWRHGGHREAFKLYGKLMLSAKIDEYYTARQRSFLRALVYHDYRKAKLRLLSKQTWFMTAYPGRGFFNVYDYTAGKAKVDIKSITVFDAVEEFTDGEWKSIVSRAPASGGKMGIHVVEMYEPLGTRRFVIPIRTNTSLVYDRQQQLAAEMTPSRDMKFVVDELYPLVMDEDGEVHNEVSWFS
ncbi:MYND-type domain-containing protein [Mycena sanguinolenta]|uniref:MYND-type domain-containing protein n=1 Tax=Mycena sanguinolenta TaxID=230812 RepID=A0A8H6XSN3_9AGAR|nr:MYND-type domain-containing protein [Mycena sanguinolenta]